MQRLSDGFVAFFGAPVAQEDHARQAVLAALELQRRVSTEPTLRAPLRSASLSTSMGLHTGVVIVGPLAEDAQTRYAALDDTTDVASRLQRLAGPDTILMSEATRRLVQEEVRAEAYDAPNMAALPQPLPIYRVREVIVRRSGVTGRGGHLLSPFVGRVRELASLVALLAQAEAGRGQVVGIVGEPGIGKSRLLYELARALRDMGVGYIEGHCFAYDQATPYGPVRSMLRQLCGMTDADSPAVVQSVLPATPDSGPWEQAILDIAAGNPFFLEELAWAVRAGGVEPPTALLPDTVHAVLAARMDRLPPVAKRLLQTAAVIGHDIPLPLLRAITELSEDILQHGLARLQAGEFLYETCPVPEPEYTFKHALTHEVAYGSLLLERRRVLHARIVEALEELAGDRLAEQVERLAYHALRGEVWDRALCYYRQAGTRAFARSAFREAVACFEQALAALQHLPERRDTVEQGIDLRFDLRNACQQLGDRGPILEHLRQAETLAQALGDQHRLGQVFSYMTRHFWDIAGYDRAIASGERALVIAAALGDFGLQAVTHCFLGQIYHCLGDYCRALDILRRNVVSLEGELSREHFGLPRPCLRIFSYLAGCVTCRAGSIR
jgi:tetratricopeptide (TPR) repeat protein